MSASPNYLDKLNPEQRRAVEQVEGPVLVLAGAGSGKTRVLTHRIAHLIQGYGVSPRDILAVTFTNKAAGEMRHRVYGLLGRDAHLDLEMRDLWVSTFHSSCVRILRSEIHRLGYDRSFTIYDDSDQRGVVKAVLKELGLGEQSFSPKAVQSRINKLKNNAEDPMTYEPAYGGIFEEGFARVIRRYTEVLRKSSAVDFADLIFLCVRLFQEQPNVLAAYQERFPFLMIDEYQDTNRCQYLLMKHLASKYRNLCAVGDEDQSIYKWRGADISNILGFERDFPEAKVFKLEENYRSTRTIIEAASHVISNNRERRPKELWTKNDSGEKITLVEAYDEHDEALKVSSQIVKSRDEGESLNQIAVFYRTNAQSRVLEDMLRAKSIPYQIFGGLKFYDRLEVKDALAYLKILVNPKDDVSFRRVLNVPARGIGAVSLEKFAKQANESGLSHLELLEAIYGKQPTLELEVGRARKGFESFYRTLESLKRMAQDLLPSELLNALLDETGYRQMLVNEGTVEAQSRLENLAELRQGIIEYELRSGADDPSKPITLAAYLDEVALVAEVDKFEPDAPSIKMMTIHTAKGLEFDNVLVVGLEEELFPNHRPWDGDDPDDVEEERRLFYVGVTRARRHLYLFYAKNRTIFGHSSFRVLSRFVEEIPKEYLVEKKADFFSRRRGMPELRHGQFPSPKKAVWDDDFSQVPPDENDSALSGEGGESEYTSGSRIEHPLFGRGVVRKTIGQDKLIVEFESRGLKKISVRFSHIKPI